MDEADYVSDVVTETETADDEQVVDKTVDDEDEQVAEDEQVVDKADEKEDEKTDDYSLLLDRQRNTMIEIEADREHAIQSALANMIVNSIEDRVSLMHQHFCTVAVHMSEVDALNAIRTVILDQCFGFEEITRLNRAQRDDLREQISRRIELCLPKF